MTASELAFLGLGLLLGAATGAALIVLRGSRPSRREIRLTVARDAVPRRSETLSQDAFVTRSGEPARGGPADRRFLDRDLPPSDRAGSIGVPVMTPIAAAASPTLPTGWGPTAIDDRTVVPSVVRRAPAGSAVTALPEARPANPEAPPGSAAAALAGTPRQTALERILRGEHLAMVEVVDTLARGDNERRRDWEILLGGLVEAMAAMAVRESVVDFPMGTAFWDAFTVEQCRQILAALGSMGFEYDGRSGWVEQHVPMYRDLSIALADIGVDPRRVRAWPNQAEIAALFNGARPAPEELLAAAGPDYPADAMQALLGERSRELADLWVVWNDVRPALLAAA